MATYSNQAAESTFLYEGLATTNYGTNAELSLGISGASQARRSLVRFPSLPSGVSGVSSVVFSLFSSSEGMSNARSVYIAASKRAWTQAGATWNKYDGTNDWGTAGAMNASDYDSAMAFGNASISATIAANAEVQFTLDNTLFAAYLNAQATYPGGFLVYMTEAATDYWNPHSNDAATAGYRPKLTFNYTVGGSAGVYMIL